MDPNSERNVLLDEAFEDRHQEIVLFTKKFWKDERSCAAVLSVCGSIPKGCGGH